MKKSSFSKISILIILIALLSFSAGCATSAQTGALAGGGIGALAGQAIGGDTEATLIGAAVGTGVGYMIGNEKDKKKAAEMSQQTASSNYEHTEVSPLANTKWQLISLSPKDRVPEYASKFVEFGPKGHVTTTTTYPNGIVEIAKESYRVVGSTLIINKPGYLINAKFGITGGEMIVDAQDFSAVLRQMP